MAGLRENDTILYINDVPTSNLSLQAAADLIDDSENLCLVVTSSRSPPAMRTTAALSPPPPQQPLATNNTDDNTFDPESELIDEIR